MQKRTENRIAVQAHVLTSFSSCSSGTMSCSSYLPSEPLHDMGSRQATCGEKTMMTHPRFVITTVNMGLDDSHFTTTDIRRYMHVWLLTIDIDCESCRHEPCATCRRARWRILTIQYSLLRGASVPLICKTYIMMSTFFPCLRADG